MDGSLVSMRGGEMIECTCGISGCDAKAEFTWLGNDKVDLTVRCLTRSVSMQLGTSELMQLIREAAIEGKKVRKEPFQNEHV